MFDEPRATASPLYAMGRLQLALEKTQTASDRAVRERAQMKVTRWRAVLEGMADGTLAVGSRTPVAGTPPWVTLEVAHGGFATGRFLAEGALHDDEVARLRTLPQGVPGTTDRERLNLWYLSDAGQAELRAALSRERYRVELPEEGALLVVAWLLDHGHDEAALDLVSELRPLMHRLRFTPRFESVPRPAGAIVRVETAGAVASAMRNSRPRPQIAAMQETLRVWHPLFDRLVALWAETVKSELPRLALDNSGSAVPREEEPVVAGGWPCQRWPSDWSQRREVWLADYHEAVLSHRSARKHLHPKSNFARLRAALERCKADSHALTGRDVGWIRRTLANTITRHGAPGSEQRAALRTMQSAIASQPTQVEIARVIAGRLDRYPAEGGIPSMDPIASDVAEGEANDVPAGHPIPPNLVENAARALEAPIDELVDRGIIGSGEVLARVLPQITGQLVAAGIDDPELRALYGQTYAAFRRRRSLLLLNLEHQVQLEELPWIAALEPFRTRNDDVRKSARQTFEQMALVALSAFPQAILPNPLVREMGALATRAAMALPLVEEVAADIFMGTFTAKWRRAAAVASRVLEGTLYARYYDLPDPAVWAEPSGRIREKVTRRWGKATAEDFAALCAARSKEARADSGGSQVAANGAILEQSQILTTHNLAVLLEALGLQGPLTTLAPDLADRAMSWVVRRQVQGIDNWRARLQMVKNTAYAWRQAIFFLSLCDHAAQLAALARLRDLIDAADADFQARFRPAVDGLAYVMNGGRFDSAGMAEPPASGRRFLGWSVGQHWMVPMKE